MGALVTPGDAKSHGLPMFRHEVDFTYIAYDGSLFKIGRSKNPHERVNGFKSTNANIKLLMFGAGISEPDLHERFHKKRRRGEWFNLDINDILEIEKDLLLPFKNVAYICPDYNKIVAKISDKGLTEPAYGVIVTGSSGFVDKFLIEATLDELLKNKESVQIVSGCISTVEEIAEDYAKSNNYRVKKFRSDYDNRHNGSGYLRNEEMLKYADAVVCFWDGYSKCTGHIIETARSYNLPIRVINI